MLKQLRGVRWAFNDGLVPDFLCGANTAVLFLSLRYKQALLRHCAWVHACRSCYASCSPVCRFCYMHPSLLYSKTDRYDSFMLYVYVCHDRF